MITVSVSKCEIEWIIQNKSTNSFIKINYQTYEIYMFIYLSCIWVNPRHSLYFGVPRSDDGQTVKNRKRVKSETPKCGEVRKMGTSSFAASQGFHFLPPSPWLQSRNQNWTRHRPRESWWLRRPMYTCPLTNMVAPDLPKPPQLVG